jgi:excisionase family DNA binding protein
MTMLSTQTEETVLTIPQAAKVCGVTRMTMWRWVKANRIQHVKTPGGHHRIDLSILNEFIGRCRSGQRQAGDRIQPKILVVDDDKSLQKYLDRLLSKWGYIVKTCSNGFEAGIWIMKFQPNLLILDLFMPRLDGFQVCRTVKGDPDTAHIHLLAVSGHPSIINVREARAAGADAFLPKPLDRQALRSHVEAVLSKRQRQKAVPMEV